MKASELKQTLEHVKPGLARKELIEQATSVIFQNGHLCTFNDEVAVLAPLELGITGAVPAEPLYAFLGKLKPDAEITIEQAENELKFSAGRNRAGIRLEPEIKLPIDEEIQEPEEWHPLPDGFVKAVQRVQFSASRSGHLPILTCIHIQDTFIETCDEFRLTRVDIPVMMSSGGIKIIARHLERLHTYSPTEFGFSGNWMQYRNKDGVIYAVRMVEGEYPDLDKFLDMTGTEVELPAELEGALDWASVVTDDSIKYEQHVDVELRKGLMIVSGKGLDGWAEESIRMRYNGQPVKFQAHPLFLKEMAKVARKVVIGTDALMINGEGFVHVVSLTPPEDK